MTAEQHSLEARSNDSRIGSLQRKTVSVELCLLCNQIYEGYAFITLYNVELTAVFFSVRVCCLIVVGVVVFFFWGGGPLRQCICVYVHWFLIYV